MNRLFTAIALVAAAPAFAQDGPSFDCAKAESSAEKLVCENADLARLDRAVAERFRAALAAARALDTGAAEAEAELRAYQRGWIEGRDECWKSADLRGCVADTYLRREAEIVAGWMLEPPTRTLFWTCGGSPANEVVTMLFDTERPAIRFERGDTIDTGALEPSLPGETYWGSFGRSIAIDGATARYREADPDGTEWDCVLAAER